MIAEDLASEHGALQLFIEVSFVFTLQRSQI